MPTTSLISQLSTLNPKPHPGCRQEVGQLIGLSDLQARIQTSALASLEALDDIDMLDLMMIARIQTAAQASLEALD